MKQITKEKCSLRLTSLNNRQLVGAGIFLGGWFLIIGYLVIHQSG
mgnify:FL=1